MLLFGLQNLHLALAHPTPVITMVTALQMKKMKVLSVNALKAGKVKTAKLVSLIDFGVSLALSWTLKVISRPCMIIYPMFLSNVLYSSLQT